MLVVGGVSSVLSGFFVVGGIIKIFVIMVDNSYVVYWVDQVIDNVTELYSVLIMGGVFIKFNVMLSSNEDVNFFDIMFDGHMVFY